MDWKKYEQIPEEFATAREIGLAAATLGAMARRGFVEILDTSPKQYRKVNSPSVKIYQLYEIHKTDYFILFKKGKKVGMLCSMSGNNILDCWGNIYDLTDVYRIEFSPQAKFEI
jgi:hypothetical protein